MGVVKPDSSIIISLMNSDWSLLKHSWDKINIYWDNMADIFQCIFLKENVWPSIRISLKFVPKGSTNNIPALVQIMAWHRPGEKPLAEPMMVRLSMPIWVTLLQWVIKINYSFTHTFSAVQPPLPLPSSLSLSSPSPSPPPPPPLPLPLLPLPPPPPPLPLSSSPSPSLHLSLSPLHLPLHLHHPLFFPSLPLFKYISLSLQPPFSWLQTLISHLIIQVMERLLHTGENQHSG